MGYEGKIPQIWRHHSTTTTGNDIMVLMNQSFTLVLSTINKSQSLFSHCRFLFGRRNSEKSGQIPAGHHRQHRTSCYCRNLASNGSDLHEENQDWCGAMQVSIQIACLTANINDYVNANADRHNSLLPTLCAERSVKTLLPPCLQKTI